MSKHKRFIVNEDALREQGYNEETIRFIKEETLKLMKDKKFLQRRNK
jgi:hypothetical protein